MQREPVVIAKKVLIIYAAGSLALMAAPAVLVWDSSEVDVLLWSVPMLAWIVGPAALATVLVARAQSRAEAWLLFGAEVATVASTVCLCAMLFLNRGSQNAQSGMGMLIFPLFQLAALLVYASVVTGAILILRRCSARV